MQAVVHYNSFNPDNIIFTAPKANKNKGLSAAIINNLTKSSLYMETPYCLAPFGLSFYDPTNGADESKKNWSLSIKASPGSLESSENVNHFFDSVRAIDEKMIDWGLEHSQLIFKKAYKPNQRSIVEALYKRCVKPSVGKDGTVYPDKMDIKINKKEDGSPDILVYKDSPEPVNLSSWSEFQELITKGMPVKVIAQFKIFIIPGSYGMTLRAVQIKIPSVSRVAKPTIYAFADPIVPSDKVSDEEEEVEVDKEDV